MKEKKMIHESFDCPRTGMIVGIHRAMLIHRRAGRIDKRVPVSFDCDCASECGVGIKSGSSISYDWTKCMHPGSK